MPSARSAQAASRRSTQPRSTARRAAPKPRRVALRSSVVRVRWERVGRVALLVVLAVVVGLYAEHALSYLSTRSQAGHQQAIVNQLTRQNAALAAQQRSLNDPATVMREARSLGMVRPGEQSYAITGQSGG